jgi:hypothetical protein
MVQCHTAHLHRTSHAGARAAHDTGTGAHAAWRHSAAPATATQLDSKQHTGRRCGGLTDVRRRRRRWGAGEEVARRAVTCVRERGELSGELGPAATGGRAVDGAESSRPAT